MTIRNVRSLLTLSFLILVVSTSGLYAQKRKPVLHRRATAKRVIHRAPVEPLYPVVSGTVIRARMNRTLNSKTARVGETFTATVTEPVYSSNGAVVVPVGATLTGRVDMVRSAAKEGRPGQIDASFTRLKLPNGRSRLINGSLTDLAGKTSSDSEGTISGKQMNHRKEIFIGGGGVGGTILGAAVGGGKGALIGAILGAGGGYLGQKLTKGPEAVVESGTEFGVYLNRSITLPKFGEVNPVNP